MTTSLILELTEHGRQQFDMLQTNLSRLVQMTDAELKSEGDPFAELFNSPKDPEERREEARNLQDRLDRQGRENYAREYAVNQNANYGN